MSSDTVTADKVPTFSEIMNKSAKSAMRGGTAGAVAMGANVACLMWMRTTVNYQYRNGGTFFGALRTLYADGGIPRFYRGVLPALIQGPLSRFGDTAANTGVLTMLNHLDTTKDMNVGIKTACASAAAATFRIFLMPVDTVKTTMQVTGKFSAVVDKVKLAGPLTLYNGALAAASATFVGHYPWFFTYNLLSEKIPKQDTQLGELGRRAILGFSASAVSDTCSNSIRVVKVYKQSYPEQLTYLQVVRNVLQESGVTGLMFRGLETKILANGLQGILFSILWKHFEEVLFPKEK
ncbi:mitochondrial carrier protein [Nitzschia inconspicua]|uniref:Mitochondrial carrier protein n=1 Tax=Nitzschia inconspicua TaxID=303405 RepID=A0A9K3KH27_9STRA|nr:mitochondrial carrier protein [Nitzschia inconspicua]